MGARARILTAAGLLLLVAGAARLCAQPSISTSDPSEPDLVLRRTLVGSEHHQTYQELRFEVPPGVTAVTVEVTYSGRDEGARIDLGLFDGERFRGWSGGNKSTITVAETEATPSYLPGPLPAGTWRLILGVPNLRSSTRAEVEARITFERSDSALPAVAFADAPLRAEPGWYRGDLHLHTGHSDGSCASQSGLRVPCPVFRTLEVAAQRGLDFVAVTEHNATSHHAALRELQPYFDRLLLVPGREITTFFGHANVFGVTSFLDFRLAATPAASLDALLDRVEAAGGLIAINHPALPSGEVCLGCGWTAPGTDFGRFAAIEVTNGGATRSMAGRVEGPLSGIPFWQARLDEGFALTAIGGSDNHDPALEATEPSAIGRPTTVVWAEELSQRAILDGIRAGRVFVDLEGRVDLDGRADRRGRPDRVLDYRVSAGDRSARMGGALEVAPGESVELEVHVRDGEGLVVDIVSTKGSLVDVGSSLPLETADERFERTIELGRDQRWLRVDLRAADGRLVVLGNAVRLTGAR